MKIIYSGLFLTLFSISIFAQDSLVIYFNKNWEEVSDKKLACNFRKLIINNDKTWKSFDYSTNKKIQVLGSYKTKSLDSRHGHFTYFFENGKKRCEGEYINNKAMGTWTYWHENGLIKAKGNFDNDKRVGQWKYWYDNEQKEAEGKYVDDNAEGRWIYWYDSGEKKSEGSCMYNLKEGVWRNWYKNRQLESEEIYKYGKLVSVLGYFEDNSIHYKGNFIDGKRDGEWIFWNIDGRIFLQAKYSRGNPIGEWIRFFKNGEKYVYYYDNGTLVNDQFGGIIISEK